MQSSRQEKSFLWKGRKKWWEVQRRIWRPKNRRGVPNTRVQSKSIFISSTRHDDVSQLRPSVFSSFIPQKNVHLPPFLLFLQLTFFLCGIKKCTKAGQSIFLKNREFCITWCKCIKMVGILNIYVKYTNYMRYNILDSFTVWLAHDD